MKDARNVRTNVSSTSAKQKYLGDKGLIVFITLLSAFVPLSTDLYLPSLPTMMKYFHVQQIQVNLTLILFFVFFSLGTLIWGPLSDKYGRRPVLLVGLSGYTIASMLCALSLNVYQLMFFRILQALSGSVASALATAIVKDMYQGRKQESVLALVQSMVVISPAVAPVVGALLLRFTSWRGVFVSLFVVGVITFVGALLFQETLEEKSHGNVIQSLGGLVVVLKNPGFASLLIIFSMTSIVTMAFISSSSYIYQETFGLSSQVYSYFFAFNAAGMLIGPLIYLKLSAHFTRFSIINTCFGVMILSGILIYTLGYHTPWGFAVMLLPATIAVSSTRPPGTFLMLEQLQKDAGAASSLMSSFATVMGSIGMIIVSFNLYSPVRIIGVLNIVFGLLCGGLWLFVSKKHSFQPV